MKLAQNRLSPKLLATALTLVGSSMIFSGTTQAQELTGTLKKIKDSGVITLGVRDSSIPFPTSTTSNPIKAIRLICV
jgi:glutamate/aspartate transport system substrate-binding protein